MRSRRAKRNTLPGRLACATRASSIANPSRSVRLRPAPPSSIVRSTPRTRGRPLTFVGGPFNGVLETPFKVGTITYFNGTTALGSTPDSINLALTLNFGVPALPPVVSSYVFTLNSTPNTADPDESADFVNLPSAFSSTDFLIGGTTYRVKLTDFENIVGDGFLTSNALIPDQARSCGLFFVHRWCPGRDSNPHAYSATRFKRATSTYSVTRAGWRGS